MIGGTIVVGGNAGSEVGRRMQRGTIAVGGHAGDFVGQEMKGGTIVLCGGAGRRPGVSMSRGTIVSLRPLSLMPTFSYAATYNPTFLRLVARRLQTEGITLPCDDAVGAYERFTGDALARARGEILVWKPR